MLLKLSSVDSSVSNMALDMKGKDEEGLINFLNLLNQNDTNVKDIGKALNLAGLNKDLAQTVINGSDLSVAADAVISGFDAMSTASSGISGKLSTLNKGAAKLATTLGGKLKSGFSTLWSTVIKSHPLISAAAAVYTGYKFVKWQQEQAFETAKNDADTWQSKDNTLQTKISNFQQLREQLDSGVLSAQEEYNIRSQILDLQKEISNTYSGQSSGINLVNGDLQTQLDILNKISAAKAQDFLDDNKDGWIDHPIKDAKKAMEEENTYDIANHIGKNTDRERLLKASIKRVNDQLREKYGKDVLELEQMGDESSLSYTGTVRDAKEVLSALRTELTDAASKAEDTTIFDDIKENISDNVKDINKTVDKFGDFYDQVREAELKADTTKYGKNGGKIAAQWLSEYEDAVNKYNEAFSSGNQETIDSAKKSYDKFYKELPKEVKEKYTPEIEEIANGLDTSSITKNGFIQALKGTDQYSKNFTKTAKALKDLNLTEDDVYNILNSSDMNDSKKRLLSLRDIAKELGIIEDFSADSIKDFIQALGDAGIITASDHIDTTALSAEQLATKVEAAQTALSNINSVISASNSDSGLLTDNITALEESFGGLDSYNAESLLSNTADGVKLNTTALKGLIEQQHKADSDDLEARIKGQNEELQKQKDILNDVTQSEDNKQNAKEQIDSITDAIERMKQAQSQLYASYKQQMELTSDYQAVLDAESTPNAGARYDNIKSKVKTAKESFDKGEIGTDDFKTVARYLSPYGFEDPDNFIENYQKAKRYLTDDSSGVINFLKDLQSKGLATMTTLADGTHEWTTSFDDAAEASKQAGMGYEFFMDMFGKAEDYGAFNTFISSAEEGELKVQDLSKQLAEAKTRMAELQSQGADESSLQGQQKVIDELEAKLGKQQGVLDDYYGSYKQKQAQQLEDAKEQLDLMSDQIKNESNQNVKDFLIANFKQLAKEYGLDYNYDENSGNISVDNDAYKDQMSQYGNTWVNPASAEDMGYKEGTQEAKDYQAAVDSLTAAHEKNDVATEEAFKTLSQYNAEELKGIELDNNKYDSDDAGLRKAEDALQMLADTYGLTKAQLLEGLEGLGQLKLGVDTSSMENLKHEATEAQEKLNEITGKTYKFNFDTSNLNTIRQQIEQAKEQLSQFQFTDSTGKKRVDYSQNGAKEATTVYAASIKQEQDAEYSNSNIGKVDTSSVEGTTKECITAAQEFMQAKNEMDVQTQLAQEGATNTLDQASQKCQQAYETFKNEATENGIKIDTSDIQTAENELLALSGEDLSTKFNVDVSDLNTALTDVQQLQTDGKLSTKIDLDIDADSMSIDNLESKIKELSKEQTNFTIDGDVEDVEKVQVLIDLLQQIHDKKVQVTAETQGAELVDQLQERISDLQGKGVTIDAIVQDDQVSQLVNEIAQLPPEVQIAIGVDESNVGNVDAIKSQIEANPASITVNYTKGEEPKKADDISGKANYTLGEHPTEAPDIQGTANYNLGSYPKTAPTIFGTAVYTKKVQASGSMTSIAHADGTAYNMLNLKPLSSAHASGNVALGQNETALTNEVGTESIVRDGVWSLLPGGPHMENLKKGDIIFSASQTKDLLEHGRTNSHARAYANGTLAVSPAHVGGPSTTGYSGLKDKYLKKSSSSSNHSSSNSSNKSNSGSSNSSGKSSSSSSKWEDVWKNIIDWFERLVKKFENRIDLAQAKAENTSNLVSQNKYLNSAITDTTKLIKYYGQGRKMYVRESDKYAKKIGLSSGLKKKVQNGTVKLENLSETNKQKVEAYQKWYDKINECKKAIQDLKKQELELYQQKLTNITDKYDALIGVYSSYSSTLESLNSWREEAGNSQAPNSAYANTIKAQYTAGQQQSKLMLDEIQKYQTEYNNLVRRYGSDHTASKEAEAKLEEIKTAYYDNQKAMTEYQNKLKELQLTYDQWQVDKYTSASDRLSNERDYKDKNNYKGSGNDLTETDYLDAIKINDKTMIALSQRRKDIIEQMKDPNINSEKYQDLKKELDDVDKSTYDTTNSTASLKKELVDFRFKPFEDAQEDLENYIDNLSDLQDMMDSDTFLNDDGSFTSHGLANIVLNGKQMEAYKQQVTDYRKQLENIQELYDNGMLTEKEYEDQTKSTIDNINKAAKNLYSSQSNMLKTYEDQITKVNDSLKDNIDKRQKALEAKKDYYDYDKTLKDKNKDINTLKQQIAALEGTTNASAKARLAQLKADLKDKEDDLADTKYEHQVDMESKGYDNLSDQADDALEKTLQAVKSNSELQKAIIDNMLKETQKSYSDAYGEINKIIEETGYKTSTMFNDLINKAELTNKKVKEVISGNYTNIDTSGIDGKRPDKGKADEGLNNTRNQSSTGQAASSEPAGAGSNNDEPKTVEQLLAKPTTSGKSTTTNQDAAEKAKRDKHNAMMLALQAWYKKIGKYTGSKEEIKNHSDLIQYFWKKGKYVRSKDLVKVAGILGHTSLSKKKYSTWTAKQKTKLLNELKNYGFSQGGVVRQLIPADANDLIGKAIIKNGDTGFITARAGETVLTEEFTKQLKPTVQSMNAFNEAMSGNGISASTPKSYQNQNIIFNPEITVNVDSISNDIDIKQLGKQLSDVMYGDFTKRMRKDLSRSTGRNR